MQAIGGFGVPEKPEPGRRIQVIFPHLVLIDPNQDPFHFGERRNSESDKPAIPTGKDHHRRRPRIRGHLKLMKYSSFLVVKVPFDRMLWGLVQTGQQGGPVIDHPQEMLSRVRRSHFLQHFLLGIDTIGG